AFRIPAVGTAPYLRRGNVAHPPYGFESIIKMIRYRFGLAPLNTRDAYARNIARAFDWASKPRLEIPDLPDPPQAVSVACPPSDQGESVSRPAEHDMVELVTSGYLERLGFDFEPAKPETIYREPHKVLSS